MPIFPIGAGDVVQIGSQMLGPDGSSQNVGTLTFVSGTGGTLELGNQANNSADPNYVFNNPISGFGPNDTIQLDDINGTRAQVVGFTPNGNAGGALKAVPNPPWRNNSLAAGYLLAACRG
jgi:hypothetical protein